MYFRPRDMMRGKRIDRKTARIARFSDYYQHLFVLTSERYPALTSIKPLGPGLNPYTLVATNCNPIPTYPVAKTLKNAPNPRKNRFMSRRNIFKGCKNDRERFSLLDSAAAEVEADA
jgi:hypothetical protein